MRTALDPDARWQKVGLAVKDNLSTGRLTAWGRRDNSNFSLGGQAPLEEIPRDYWRSATLMMNFFLPGEDHRGLVHARPLPKFGGPQYRDVQFNRAEALKIWPRQAPDITIGRASNYLAHETLWGDGKGEAQIFAALDEALLAGKLTAWGQLCITPTEELETATSSFKKNMTFTEVEVPIPLDAWKDMKVEQRFVGFHDHPSVYMPHMAAPRGSDWVRTYGRLRLNKAAVQQIWPPKAG
jgi:hypothetical protein